MSTFDQFDINAFGKLSREQLRELARIAEQTERYEDMCKVTKRLVEVADDDLTPEERNYLSVAYKNVVGSRRAAWRTLNVDEHKDQPNIVAFKKVIENELRAMCLEVINLIEKHLVSKAESTNNHDSVVFFRKMMGDYYRYLAEFADPAEKFGEKATDHYETAWKHAQSNLSPTHPIRLGLALNYSVCHYEIRKEPKKACELAKAAFDEAISKLDQLDEASYKDSTLIMQLLRDNLTLWTSEENEE